MWKAVNRQFDADANMTAVIYISCVDSVQARFEIAEVLKQDDGRQHYANIPRYWTDFGNGRDTGQVIVGAVKQPSSEKFETVERLPFITEEFGELLRQSETDDAPSCSLAEALVSSL